MALTWHRRPLLGVALETTGTDPETARIVTAAVVRYGGGRDTHPRTWVSNVDGQEIPPEATAVHGWTTAAARFAGRPAAEVVEAVLTALAEGVESGWPIVVMNAPHDLTVLDREARRSGLAPLDARAEPFVIDPRVLDMRVDRHRLGGRTLEDLCRHYVIALDDVHTPDQDAKAACAVAWKIANRHKWLTRRTPRELHAQQAQWALDQQEADWPLIPASLQAAEQ